MSEKEPFTELGFEEKKATPLKKEPAEKKEKKESLLFEEGFDVTNFYIHTGKYNPDGTEILEFDNDAYETYINSPEAEKDYALQWEQTQKEMQEEWTPASVEDYPDYYERCFAPYLEDFELCARVYKHLSQGMLSQDMRFNANLIMNFYDKKSGFKSDIDYTSKEWLGRKPKPTVTDSIRCIHAGRSFTPAEIQVKGIEQVQNSVLQVKNSEWDSVQLETKDKFYALKSWTGGIVKHQFESMQIQQEIEQKAGMSAPLSQQIAQFVLKSKPDLADYYLDTIKRDCTKDVGGVITSIENCILPRGKAFLDILDQYIRDPNKYHQYVNKLLAMNPSIRVFDDRNPRALENPNLIDHPDFSKLFKYNPEAYDVSKIYIHLANNPRILDPKIIQFSKILFDPKIVGEQAYMTMLKSPYATELDNFCEIVEKANSQGLRVLLQNPKIGEKCSTEIHKVFAKKDPEMLKILVSNPSTITFPEYSEAVEDLQAYSQFAANIEAVEAHIPLAIKVLDKIKKSDTFADIEMKKNLAKSKKLGKEDIFGELLNPSQHKSVIAVALENPEASTFTEYDDLFKEESPVAIRSKLASSDQAASSPNFPYLFLSKKYSIIHNLINRPDISLLSQQIADKDFHLMNLLFKEDINPFPDLRANLALKAKISDIDPKGEKFPAYYDLFSDESALVRQAMASNSDNTDLLAYKAFFQDSDPDVKIIMGMNPESPIKYPKEFGSLISDAIRSNDPFLMRSTINNINAPKIPEFKQYFTYGKSGSGEKKSKRSQASDFSHKIRATVAQNPQAAELSNPNEYPSLFIDPNQFVRRAVGTNTKAFEKYPTLAKELFEDFSADVRLSVSQNQAALSRPEFKEDYAKLFVDSNQDVLRYACKMMPIYMRNHNLSIVPTNNCNTVLHQNRRVRVVDRWEVNE